MDTVRDFEDLLDLFAQHDVRFLIIGGLAFIFHAKPRFTKDMDIWLDPDPSNIDRANRALADFGSPHLLDREDTEEILQLGVAPNRVDLLRDPASAGGPDFDGAWASRIRTHYGAAPANWISLEHLLEIKSHIDDPRHQEDARVLRQVQELRREKSASSESPPEDG